MSAMRRWTLMLPLLLALAPCAHAQPAPAAVEPPVFETPPNSD